MKLSFRVTNRAVLRSGKDMQGNHCIVDCEIGELPHDVRRPLADRLYADTFVCEGVLNAANAVEPRLGDHGEPVLLVVDGTELRDLVETVRHDQREIEEYLFEARSEKNLTQV